MSNLATLEYANDVGVPELDTGEYRDESIGTVGNASTTKAKGNGY